jgi:diacylglycerol O-acyltransferase / wax synthase
MPPAFGLSQHVQVVPLPAPGDEAALLLATEQLRRRRLDRSRPLWQMCFLPGLPANRVGMFAKMHHAIANGIAGMATLGTLLDAVPDAPTRPVQPWTPAPAPTAPDLFADNLRRHTGNLGRALSALAQPATTTRHLMAAWPAIRELFAEEPGPRTSLDRVVGPDRNLALIRANLDQVRHIAHTHHARSTTSCWRSPPTACAGSCAAGENPSRMSSYRFMYPSRCARHSYAIRHGEI